MKRALSGSCLCESVQFEAEEASDKVGACHCSMCRRWGGGPFMSVDCGSNVTIKGETLRVFESSKWAERGFCSACGTHLFYRLKSNNQHFMLAGAFSGQPEFDFDHQVFVDERPNYYCFSNKTKDMTGPEVMALFAGPPKP